MSENIRDINTAYAEYLRSDDKTVTIGGRTYYKIIFKIGYKGDFHGGRSFVSVTVPPEAARAGGEFEDENGKRVRVGGVQMMSFGGRPIPEWYLRTATVWVEGVEDAGDIGEYLAPVE